MQGLVGAGIGYAVVPLLAVEASPDVAVLNVAGMPPRRIAIAWHADRAPSAAAEAFVTIVPISGPRSSSGYAQAMSVGSTGSVPRP